MESMVEAIIALVALTAMEIVLGIDNIVFITILSSRLPKEQQSTGRKFGLLLALVTRLLLLFSVTLLMGLTSPVFRLEDDLGLPISRYVEKTASATHDAGHPADTEHPTAPDADTAKGNEHASLHGPEHGSYDSVNEVTWKDLILLLGGLFLIWKSVTEIHEQIEGEDDAELSQRGKKASFTGVLFQIMLMDVIFSLDSVITAVGMVDPNHQWVIYTAVILAVGVMIAFSEPVNRFVEENPTLKMLALSFLILIGVLLVAEGSGTGMNKRYIYFAMAFALVVEFLNMKIRVKRHAAAGNGRSELAS